jgi:hypothetical protein
MDYIRYGKAIPPQSRSTYIVDAKFDKHRYHQAVGDMWPLTWGADDNIYGAAGDNRNSPMNFWRISGKPTHPENNQGDWIVDLIDNLPIDPSIYCKDPRVDKRWGIKPASLLDIDGTLYFAVEAMNYGTEPSFNRQTNVHGWIITTKDYGKTWNREATPLYFFTGRLASCHFLQFGKGYEGSRDEFVYAYFPAADDGNSYWENGDYILLGRVHKDRILVRDAWEFYTGLDKNGEPTWNKNDKLAVPVFRYPKMTGENHVSYNPGIKRYIMGNYGFVDDDLNPRPYHQGTWPESTYRSQLTLYEAPEPWGPWSLFYQDDNWGTYGDYQPSFPTKWMSEDGRTMFMVSAGSWDDYNFTVQKLTIKIAGDK